MTEKGLLIFSSHCSAKRAVHSNKTIEVMSKLKHSETKSFSAELDVV